MDSLSSSVSNLKVAALHTTPRELYPFKAPTTSPQLHPHQSHLCTATKPNKTATSFTRNSFSFPLFNSAGTSTHTSATPNTHQKPASGYAAALLDKALCQNSLAEVQKDVQKLSRMLKNEQLRAIFSDPFVGEEKKGQIVKEMVDQGKVNRYLSGLLRMLIERNKLGMVTEVLEEFERIYDEMIGTRVLFVSSAKKMEEDELFVIAKRVQKLSGAAKLKIRNLVADTVPFFVG